MDDIVATCKLAEKGSLLVVSMYRFEPTPEAGPGLGDLHLGTSLTMRIDGKPFLDQDILVTKRDHLSTWKGVSDCHFFDVIGTENRRGNLLDIAFEKGV